MATTAGQKASRILAWIALGLAVVATLLILGATFGYRANVLDLMTALLQLLPGGVLAGLLALLVLFARQVLVWLRGNAAGSRLAVAALVLALAVTALPLSMIVAGSRVPQIHDISTDTDDPPAFVAVLPLRAAAANPPDYPGPDVAAIQKKAYPDVLPIDLSKPPVEAFAAARAAVDKLGWTVVDANAADGRIEATTTSFWFRFTDDVVIRIRPIDGGSRIDIRSKSRIGRSDLGANANRIRAFREALS